MSPATPWPPLAGRTARLVTALLIAGALGLGVATMRARREPPSLEEDVVMGRIGDALAGRYHAENAHHLGTPPFEWASAGLKFHLWLESVRTSEPPAPSWLRGVPPWAWFQNRGGEGIVA